MWKCENVKIGKCGNVEIGKCENWRREMSLETREMWLQLMKTMIRAFFIFTFTHFQIFKLKH